MKHGNLAFFVPHAGCPQQCSFCNQRVITGTSAPTPREVEETCRQCAEQLGSRVQNTQIAFFGGSFTAIGHGQMRALLEPAAKAAEKFGFAGIRCSTRPDTVDAETLKLLQAYGVTAVELGAQSMDDRVLALNRRGHTAAQTAEAAGLIHSFGMELGLQMMTGLYGDTDETAIKTVESIIALHPETARIYPTVVLPGTELARLYEKGLYRPQTLEEAVGLCARLLSRLEDAEIRVIRMGLHAEQGLEAQRLAGPYHPAFRELVQSRLFLEKLLPVLTARETGSYCVLVNPRSLSAAAGEKKSNREYLRRLGYQVRFAGDPAVARGEFRLAGREENRERKQGPRSTGGRLKGNRTS